MTTTSRYADYFVIDKDYFPCVDEDAIKKAAPDFWTKYYPHDTFIDLLKKFEKIIGRSNVKTLWIEGAYGTGKSYAAHTLKRILEVNDNELKTYFKEHQGQQKLLTDDLLNKYLGHKKNNGKIMTAFRYASGSIHSTQDLLLAVQQSIQKALKDAGVKNHGEGTLKEGILRWLNDSANKNYFNALLEKPDYSALFSGQTANDIIADLSKSSKDTSELVRNIFKLASDNGITAMKIDTENLKEWLTDVIQNNKLKAIVLIWDEFSDFFKNNRNSLSDFQSLISLCQSQPFYFVIVTHETGAIFSDGDKDGRKIFDRFERCEISLPTGIAFDLIAAAIKKKTSNEKEWNKYSDDLNDRVSDAQKMVAKAESITNNALQRIIPITPTAALLLKHISSAFASNQRSMFDFIKNTDTDDSRAFQWFIQNRGPLDDNPLLTIDHLWNFFYEKGKENLSPDIRSILSIYSRFADRLLESQKRVLKTVLMMEAIGSRLGIQFSGGKESFFHRTEENIALAFEGTDLDNNRAITIADNYLVADGILYNQPLGMGGKKQFSAALVGDNEVQVKKIADEIKVNLRTIDLIQQAKLTEDLLPLTLSQKQRFSLTSTTLDRFATDIKQVRNDANTPNTYKIYILLCFAKDEKERGAFQSKIKEAVKQDENKNVIILDATHVHFNDNLNDYVNFFAYSEYYRTSNQQLANDYSNRVQKILTEWKEQIAQNQFRIYCATLLTLQEQLQNGKYCANVNAVMDELKSTVKKKYRYSFDDADVSEAVWRQTNFKSGAKCGLERIASQSFKGLEDKVLATEWKCVSYWETYSSSAISKIKISLDKLIAKHFEKSGHISVHDILAHLQEFGFFPCGLYSFLTGFLLKEYGTDQQYRFSDGNTGGSMTVEKFAEMLESGIKNIFIPDSKYRDCFLVLQTEEERAFFKLLDVVFRISSNNYPTPELAVNVLSSKLKELQFPLWTLHYTKTKSLLEDYIDKLAELVSTDGNNMLNSVDDIGKKVKDNPQDIKALKTFITVENIASGMKNFLERFENGRLLDLAKEISTRDYLQDVAKQFDASESLWLWDKNVGEERIRDLIADYRLIACSNQIVSRSSSLDNCFKMWKEKINSLKLSQKSVMGFANQELRIVLQLLYDAIVNNNFDKTVRLKLLGELEKKTALLQDFFDNQLVLFRKVCVKELAELSDEDTAEVMSTLPKDCFYWEREPYHQLVDDKVKEYKRTQAKAKLHQLWKEKTNTTTPQDWSEQWTTPILCMLSTKDYENGKQAFNTINANNPTQEEINFATNFVSKASIIRDLDNDEKRNVCFTKHIIKEFSLILTDITNVRKLLREQNRSVPVYDWFPRPDSIENTLRQAALADYKKNVYKKAIQVIDNMEPAELKKYLKQLFMENMTVGIAIIASKGEK
jgi:DNA-binding ferritin-like protein